MKTSPAAYQVLVVDDSTKEGGFADVIKIGFSDDPMYEIDHVTTPAQLRARVQRKVYDIIVFDMFLGNEERGDALLLEVRSHGFQQPLILATGHDSVPGMRLEKFRKILSQGPTYIHLKGGRESILETVQDAATKTDVLLRALNIFQRAKVPFGGIRLGERVFTLEDLLGLAKEELKHLGEDPVLRQARVALRNSLATLILSGTDAGSARSGTVVA